jgi:glucosamine--fructose-6-phosphate aminotransferase (isomerizing)
LKVVCLALATLWFSEQRNDPTVEQARIELVTSLQRLPTVFGMALQCHDNVKRIAERIVKSNCNSIFVLGKGLAEPVALEGALKVFFPLPITILLL